MLQLLKKNKVLNVSSSLLQVFVSAIVSIIISKYTFKYLGSSLIGFWAITLSISAFGAFLNSGICVAVIRFTALSNNEHDHESVSKIALTSLLVSLLLTILACVLISIIYIIYFIYQPPTIDIEWIQYCLFALGIFIATSLSNVIMNIFDGLKLTYFKNIIIIAGSLIYFFAGLLLIREYKLKGVAVSLIIQNVFTLLVALIILKQKRILKLKTLYYDKPVAKELLRFSFRVQYITVLGALFDPITKTLMSYFGNYSNVGIYEMANRIVAQIRTVLVNLNQLLLPYFSKREQNDSEKRIYLSIYDLLITPSVIMFISIIIFAKPISYFWLGGLNKEFLFYTTLLSVSALVNVISMPSYYSRLGNGILKPLIKAHIFIGVLNVAAGIILGMVLKAKGVAVAWSLALLLGSLLIMMQYSKDYRLSFLDHMNKNWVLIVGGLALVFTPLIWEGFFTDNYYWLLALYGIWVVIVSALFFVRTIKPIVDKYRNRI